MAHRPPPRRAVRPWGRLAAAVAGLAVAGWAATFATVLVLGARDGAAPADAIIVLGAAQYGGRPSPVLKARLDHAIDVWRRGLAPHLVLTGGVGEGDQVSEAAASRRYVLRAGVPDSALLLEHDGRSTRESLRNAAQLLRARGWQRAILVSDPFHMLRLRVLAVRYGLTPLLSPTRTSPISDRWTSALGYAFSESLKAPAAFVFEPALD